MALQIANAIVVAKVEKLARAIGLSKTAAVERAVDQLLERAGRNAPHGVARLDALLAQIDRIPERVGSAEPLPWDEHGLPR